MNSPEGLNPRAALSLEARVLMLLPHNTRLTPTGRSLDGKWGATSYSDRSGWGDASYLMAVEEQADQPAGGRHVWFELRINGATVDPLAYLPR